MHYFSKYAAMQIKQLQVAYAPEHDRIHEALPLHADVHEHDREGQPGHLDELGLRGAEGGQFHWLGS